MDTTKNSSKRVLRVGETLKRSLALLFAHKHELTKQMPIFTFVNVSADLSSARVYFTLNKTKKSAEIVKELNKQSGLIRHHIKPMMRLNRLPKLYFYYDETLEKAHRINSLLNNQ